MQKRLFLSIPAIAIILLCQIQCTKDSHQIPINELETFEEGISFEKEYIAFASIESYLNFVSEINNEKLDYITENHSDPLSRALKTGSGESKNDYVPELLALLSADMTINIGEWIIKVDMPNDLILALNLSNQEHYNDLLENKSNELIYSFKPTDDVLEILANGDLENYRFKGTSALTGCADRRADAKSLEEDTGDGWRFGKVRYYAAGLYFSLYGIINNNQIVWVGSQRADVTIDLEYTFDDRCNRSYEQLSTAYDTDDDSFPATGSQFKLKVYESGKALKEYALKGNFTSEVYNQYGGYGGTFSTGDLSISDY